MSCDLTSLKKPLIRSDYDKKMQQAFQIPVIHQIVSRKRKR